jgi:hypothetical protein
LLCEVFDSNGSSTLAQKIAGTEEPEKHVMETMVIAADAIATGIVVLTTSPRRIESQ